MTPRKTLTAGSPENGSFPMEDFVLKQRTPHFQVPPLLPLQLNFTHHHLFHSNNNV